MLSAGAGRSMVLVDLQLKDARLEAPPSHVTPCAVRRVGAKFCECSLLREHWCLPCSQVTLRPPARSPRSWVEDGLVFSFDEEHDLHRLSRAVRRVVVPLRALHALRRVVDAASFESLFDRCADPVTRYLSYHFCHAS